MNVVQAFRLALGHMVDLLFRPFALRKWLALGFIALIAYVGTGYGAGDSSCGVGNPSASHQQKVEKSSPLAFPGESGSFSDQHRSALASDESFSDALTRALFGWRVLRWIIPVAMALIGLGLLILWLSSMFGFVYVHNISTDSYGIRDPFGRLKRLGRSYFLWQLAFIAAVLLIVTAFWGLERWGVPSSFVLAVISGAVMLCLMITAILAQDFVVPTMYIKGTGVVEAWRTVLPILRANVGQIVLYFLSLLVMDLISVIFALIVLALLAIIFVIPVAILGAIGYAIHHAVGHSATRGLVIGGLALVPVLVFALIWFAVSALQPIFVIRRAFSMILLGQADPSLAAVPVRTSQSSHPECQGCQG